MKKKKLKRDLSTMESYAYDLEEEIKTLKKICDKLRADLKDSEERVKTLCRINNGGAKQVGELRADLACAVGAHNASLTTITNLRAAVADVKSRCSCLQARLDARSLNGATKTILEDDLNAEKLRNKNQQHTIVRIRHHTEHQRHMLEALWAERKETKHENFLLTADNRHKDRRINEMTDENEKAKELIKRNISLEATIDRLRGGYYLKEIDRLNIDLKTALHERDGFESIAAQRNTWKDDEEHYKRAELVRQCEAAISQRDEFRAALKRVKNELFDDSKKAEVIRQRDDSVRAYQLELEAKNELIDRIALLEKAVIYVGNHRGGSSRSAFSFHYDTWVKLCNEAGIKTHNGIFPVCTCDDCS